MDGVERVAEGRLDPGMAAALAKLRELAAAVPMPAKPGLADARRRMAESRRWFNEAPPALAEVRDFSIAGPIRQVPARLYRPAHAKPGGPGIVYAHGGGWFSGSLDTHDRIMRLLALESGMALIGVDPAQAPEFKFPQPVEEMRAVLAAVAARAADFGIDAGRLAFAGCSSGANLALAAFLAAPLANYRAGALFYGSYGDGEETASMREFADGRYGMGAAEIAWCWKNYTRDPAERRDPRAAPLLSDLARAPPLFLAAAELDPLRDDSVALAARLAALGRAHRLEIYAGLGHSYLGYERLVPRARDTIRDAAAFLNSQLGAAP